MAGRNVTRSELNSSLLRLEERMTRLDKRHAETNKIIREQNSQFATLLGQEGEKREEWCSGHDKSHEELEKNVNKRSSKVLWYIIGVLTTLLTGGALYAFAFLIARH